MTKHLFSILLLGGLYANTRAQTVAPTVFASDGGYSQNAAGSISWSIGEPVSETYNSASYKTTMGFHQPEIDIINMIAEQGNEASILVYPNPVNDELKINFSRMNEGDYSIEIIDAIGKLIYRTNTVVSGSSKTTILRLDEYASANYFVVISGKNFQKNIKITKTN